MSARGGGVEGRGPGRHGRKGKYWRGHDIRMRHDSLRLCVRAVRPGVALLCDGATRRVSIYRTEVEVSSNLNDREPVNGVNTPRMCRYLRRITAGPYGRDVGRHTANWPSRTPFDAGLEEASAYSSRPRPVAPRHPPTTAPGVRRPGGPKVSDTEQKLFCNTVLTMHRQYLNHSCLGNRPQFDISNHTPG
jgi:hypothetical protein